MAKGGAEKTHTERSDRLAITNKVPLKSGCESRNALNAGKFETTTADCPCGGKLMLDSSATTLPSGSTSLRTISLVLSETLARARPAVRGAL